MPDCSTVANRAQFGNNLVDLATGEILDFTSGEAFARAAAPGGSASAERAERGESESSQAGRVPAREGSPSPDGAGPAGRGPRQAGLSQPHICTQHREPIIKAWAAGTLVKAQKRQAEPQEQKGGGKRGKVQSFTVASRRRMRYLLATVERAALPVMVTLTYPSEFPAEGKVWKNDLRKWWQRLKRRVPGVGAIWKLEPQKRGAPHFHLLVWGLAKIPIQAMRNYIAKSWYEVVGSGDEKHLRAGTGVEVIRDWRGVRNYASKYIGKLVDEHDIEGWDEPGRFWGVKSSDCIPWAECIEMTVSDKVVNDMFRYMRRHAHMRARASWGSLNVFSDDPWRWLELAELHRRT